MIVHLQRGATLAAALVSLVAITLPVSAGAQGPAATAQKSTYLGGTSTDSVNAVLQNSDGEVVVVGTTSSESLVPGAPPAGPRSNGLDIFVAHFDTDGATMSTDIPLQVFGGAGDEEVTAATLGPGNVLYIVGKTTSATLLGMPVFRPPSTAGPNAFLARVNASGTPDWFLFLSGDGQDVATGVTVIGENVYVSGFTSSTDFLGTSGRLFGGTDGFVVQVVPTGTSADIGWSGQPQLVGGRLADSFLGITADVSEGKLLAAGTTAGALDVPPEAVKNAFKGGNSDAFVAKLDAATGALEWISYVGGNGADEGKAIATGPESQSFVVAGSTDSTNIVPGPIPANKNAFVAWVTGSGRPRLIQVRGGDLEDEALCVTTDDNGVAYVGGRTASTNFQRVASGFDTMIEPGTSFREGFVWMAPPEGGDGWASYVGSTDVDEAFSLSQHASDKLVIGMRTDSTSGLPGTPVYDSSASSVPDGYVLNVSINDPSPPTVGMVFDRLEQDDIHQDVDETTSTTSLFANWTEFTDANTGIAKYDWAIGTAQNPTSIQPFTEVMGAQLSAAATGLTLTVGETYIVTVRAQNGHGLTSIVGSNGITVIESPPPDGGTDGGMGGDDGGTGSTDGGTDGGTDAGMDGGTGGTDGGKDGGTGGTDGGDGGGEGPGEEPREPESPLGWEMGCASAGGAGPLFIGLIALMLLRRRLGQR